MSAEKKLAIGRRYSEETFNRGNLALMDELFVPNYVNHGSIPGQPMQDRDRMQRVSA